MRSLLLLALAGCTQLPEVASSSAPIIGGTVDTGDT